MRVRLAILAVFVAVATVCVAADDPRPTPAGDSQKFLRLRRDGEQKPAALETAIVRCTGTSAAGQPLAVDLIAALHIADKPYYQRLNREFRLYDAVLYELVAPERARVPRKSDPVSSHPVSLLQNGMKDVLALEFQLKQIDYTARNMVHADMSPEQVARSMEKNGESMTAMLVRMLGYAMSKQDTSDGPNSEDVFAALFAKDRPLALKRVLAEEFDHSEGAIAAIEGPGGSTLISGRNKVAMEVLRGQIAAGKRKIAIFYGSAHMADFEQRLRDEFGLAPVSVRWLVAWDLKPSGGGK